MSSLQGCSSVCGHIFFNFSCGTYQHSFTSSPVENPLNNQLNGVHQRFRKKMDQLADMHVCSICKECYPGIVTKNFHGAYACSHCILEWKAVAFHWKTIWIWETNQLSLQYLHKLKKCSLVVLTQSCKWHMLIVVNINTLAILFASPNTFPIFPHTYHI